MKVIPDKEKSVQRMFTSVAKRYDLLNTVLSLGLHHRWKKIAVNFAQVEDGDNVLDLCTGTADIAILLAERVGDRGKVVALDLNMAMMELGKEKVRRRDLEGRIRFVHESAEALGFPDNTFDTVTVGFGIRNVSSIEKAFIEVLRVLKSGGRFICLEFSHPPNSLFCRLYDFYSFSFIPWVGALLSGDKTGTYRYLPESIRGFPEPEQLKGTLLAAGFCKVEYTLLAGGIVAIHKGIK